MGKLRQGFTLIELLVVVAILVMLLVVVLLNVKGQSAKAADIKRKTDLSNLHKAFEEYFNDHNEFPADTVVYDCGGPSLAPYLSRVPCDPVTKSPYGYFPVINNGGYRVCCILSDKTDPAITATGCGGSQGCGVGFGFNYCLASGVTPSAIDMVGSIEPTGGPTEFHFACAPLNLDGISSCKSYADPEVSGCPWTYKSKYCNSECQINPAARCIQ